MSPYARKGEVAEFARLCAENPGVWLEYRPDDEQAHSSGCVAWMYKTFFRLGIDDVKVVRHSDEWASTLLGYPRYRIQACVSPPEGEFPQWT